MILTVDGPSLGGFVCPITIPSTELWKVGQLKPSDKVRFKLLDLKRVIRDKQSVEEEIQVAQFDAGRLQGRMTTLQNPD